MADCSTFFTAFAMRLGEKVSSLSAASAVLPRIDCATRLSLRGLVLSIRPMALACVSWRTRARESLPILRSLRLLVRGVAVERARRRELAELVAHHVFRDEHRDVLLAVVDAESEAHELRQDRRAPRPGLDHFLASTFARGFCFLEQIAVDKRAFPNRTGHISYPCVFLAWRERTMYFVVRLFERVFAPLVGLPHGVTGWRPPLVRPSPPPCGWSIGFIAVPRTEGRLPFHTLRPALPMISFMWSGFDTAPTVARHDSGTRRTSSELRRRIA